MSWFGFARIWRSGRGIFRGELKLGTKMAWTITLRAEGPGPAEEIRIRRALKLLLRRAGLRCLRVERQQGPEAREQNVRIGTASGSVKPAAGTETATANRE